MRPEKWDDSLGGIFGPEKKYLAPPPPPKVPTNIPGHSTPSHTCPGEPPPFSIRSRPPLPSRHLGLPQAERIKNIRNVHRAPKWGFGVAMLPVGALCFYQAHFGRGCFQNAHFGRISSTLYFTVFLGGHASARRVSHEPCFRQAHGFSCGGFCASSLCPQIPHVPTPTFGAFRYFDRSPDKICGFFLRICLGILR